MLALTVEGDKCDWGLGEGDGREGDGWFPGHEQVIFRRLQFPHVGRASSHLTRLDLHFMQPKRDFLWPILAGLGLPSFPWGVMAVVRIEKFDHECHLTGSRRL